MIDILSFSRLRLCKTFFPPYLIEFKGIAKAILANLVPWQPHYDVSAILQHGITLIVNFNVLLFYDVSCVVRYVSYFINLDFASVYDQCLISAAKNHHRNKAAMCLFSIFSIIAIFDRKCRRCNEKDNCGILQIDSLSCE